MSRDIKFRAWDNKTNDWFNRYGNPYFLIENEGEFIQDSEEYIYDEPGRIILSQFTGLSDKNGKEIYEGDIVEVININNDFKDEIFNCVVEFRDYSWQLIGRGRYYVNKPCQIIGNIYENPELISTEEK